jgi:hydrogenase maturation protein HypF
MVQQAQLLLRQGEIVAVKGLGGFHLACDATNAQTVQRLRTLKHRWDKPFALMAADLNVVYTICEIDATEIELLTNRKRPIVLLKAKQRTAVAPAVAPNQKTLGVMLPYTPLHHLLLAASPVSLLVMTSANLSDEPIIYRDEEVTEKLDAISDFVLTHNRTIHMRCDDTVFQVVNGLKQPLRRSRGYAPQPLSLGFEFHQPVLAVGAHLKNTFCLGKNRHAFLSHHIGDLENLETLTSFQEGVKHFDRLFDISPQIVAHDLHPDYLSSRYALELENLTPIAVQHHHAHIASVMAEHKLTEPLIGVAFDGSGYGPDGTIWGGEFLVADLGNFERVAHLRQVALPGGEKAIHQPWRVAAAWLQQLYGDEWLTWELPFSQNLDGRSWQVMKQMIEQELNSPQTSSMGRLFDAVAALIGLRQAVTYEGQAAIELEAIADKSISDRYDFCLRWPALDPGPLFEEVIADLQKNVPTPVIAAKFHNSIAGVITAVCLKLRQERGLNQVALSGGVFQNAFLLSRTMEWLHKNEFELFINQQVPPNDGGIALGQAAIAAVQTSDTPDFSYPSEPVTEQHKEKPCV